MYTYGRQVGGNETNFSEAQVLQSITLSIQELKLQIFIVTTLIQLS